LIIQTSEVLKTSEVWKKIFHISADMEYLKTLLYALRALWNKNLTTNPSV